MSENRASPVRHRQTPGPRMVAAPKRVVATSPHGPPSRLPQTRSHFQLPKVNRRSRPQRRTSPRNVIMIVCSIS